MSSLNQLKQLLVEPIDTAIWCRNKIKVIQTKECNPTAEENKKDDAWDAYAGDVCIGSRSKTYPDFAHVKDGYRYTHSGRSELDASTAFISIFKPSNTNNPQILFIKPPIESSINYNYFHHLIDGVQNIYESMINSNSLTKELMYEILQYLPFKFPIFISSTSIYRGRYNWTHFTYPYTKDKDYIIEYMRKCSNMFDAMGDCAYEAEFYLMKDDAQMQYKDYRDVISQRREICIPFDYDPNTLQRVWKKPLLICRVKTNKLMEILDLNDVGGSYWLSVYCPKNTDNIQWFEHADVDVDLSSFKGARIGGSCGIKSRCWYQTSDTFQAKYLPMTVVNVTCGSQLLRQILMASFQ